ncbi:hypothetical protein D3C73_1415760 [compost metagenome]
MRLNTFAFISQHGHILRQLKGRIRPLLAERGIDQRGLRTACRLDVRVVDLPFELVGQIHSGRDTEPEFLHILVPDVDAFGLVFVVQSFADHIDHEDVGGMLDRQRRVHAPVYMA